MCLCGEWGDVVGEHVRNVPAVRARRPDRAAGERVRVVGGVRVIDGCVCR